MNEYTLHQGDCLEVLPTLAANSIHCVVTSPPYFGLRDYGHDDQIGLEPTPDDYVTKLVNVFSHVWRVLRDDGTVWLNLGDSYWGGKGKSGYELPHEAAERKGKTLQTSHNMPGYMDMRPSDGRHPTIKPKDLIGIPWRVALALQADGWWLRSDIIWHKPNPMPESVTDRPTKSHEYVFLLTKSARYYYDSEAIQETAAYDGRKDEQFKGSIKNYDGVMPDGQPQSFARNGHPRWNKNENGDRIRNRRSVWTIPTAPYKGAHFATFPPALVEPCILAGCPVGGTVLDPFAGSGTVGAVACKTGRQFVGVELNADYILLAKQRIDDATRQLRLNLEPLPALAEWAIEE